MATGLFKASGATGGVKWSWAAEHATKDGTVISRMILIGAPLAPTCLTPSCVWQYWKDATFYALLCNYNERRVAYCEANRGKKLLDRYRTGEPQPETIWQAVHANIKLKCPACRKFNKDPLLFRKGEKK